MKLHRFYIPAPAKLSGEVTLSDQGVIHQIKDVLRLKPGTNVILFDGNGTEFHGELTLVSKGEIRINEKEIKKVSNLSKIKMNLYFSMIKKDKAEWVLQKCTELGVTAFYPVISERTEKPNLNVERAEKIIQEAAEQSGRSEVPMLHGTMSLKGALEQCETSAVGAHIYVAALHMDGARLDVSQVGDGGEISLFVGPEGGWSEKDMPLFAEHNVPLVSIGHNVLRAETASVAASAVVLL